MKIEHVQVGAFGRLSGFDTGATPLRSLVVVLGPNEAGKSTLFNFLTTSLYGFHPASRERNPHVPWGEEEAGGRIGVRLDDGSCASVERRLRSSPSGRLMRGEEPEDLRNQPVPWVDHVPGTVFEQVYAVTLADLAGLDEETWAGIQDRMLGSMGATDLRSARDVADALEKEAGELWRPNRRGNQKVRELQERIRSLRSRRAQALENDRRIRGLVEERQDVDLELGDVRADRHRDRVVIERMQELVPIKRRLDHVAALRAEGGPREELGAIGAEPRARLETLERESARLAGEISALDEECVEPRAIRSRFDDDARRLLDQRGDVSAFTAAAASAASDRARLRGVEERLDTLAVRLQATADGVLSAPLDASVSEAISTLSVELLADRIDRLEAARRERAEEKEQEPRSASTIGTPAALALATTGLALLAWGVSGGPLAATIFGAALVAAAATLALVGRRAAGSSAFAQPDRSVELGDEIGAMFASIPLRPAFADRPGAPLVSELRRLRDFVLERRDLQATRASLRRRLEEVDVEADRIGRSLGFEPGLAAEDLAERLDRAIQTADRARDAVESAERELTRIERRRDTLTAARGDADRAIANLRARIDAVGGGRGTPPLEVVERRIAAHERAERIEDELDRAHPDLADIKSRIREGQREGTSWVVDEEDLGARKARIEEIEMRIEQLIARSKALERDAEHYRGQETVDAVDSEIATLEEEEERLIRERDRRWVLAQLVREADRRFREEHQPDLVRRASGYLKRLTGGRYDRLLVDEYGDGDLFQLVGPALPAPVPLARPISTGTLEQAYLSLRLAIVDHLDQGKERLPLFFDEAFVNWDAERRDRGLEVLAEVAQSRQVFAFTCHPEMADRLHDLGACVLRLGR